MPELTNLEEKLAEVTGLAMAAQQATRKVHALTRKQDEKLAAQLKKMQEEAAETERRCKEVAGAIDGKKTAILKEAREVKQKAVDMMGTYLDDEADALDGFEFLTMAEAAEMGHWNVLGVLNAQARNGQVGKLVRWATPIQTRHFDAALEGSKKLAAEEDPNEES